MGAPQHVPRFGLLFALGSLLICLSASKPIANDSPEKKPLSIQERYWQVLPVGWVYVDHAGNPWFRTGRGDVAKTYHKKLHTMADEIMLLGDRSGRIWINQRYKNEPTRYFDGKTWRELDFKARLATEDDAGRVFLVETTTIHVLDKTTWSKKRIFAEENWSTPQFKTDGKGRTWFWSYRPPRGKGDRYRGTRGVWVFDKGEWTNHHTGSGFLFDDVQDLAPLSNDRFLVLSADQKHSPNYSVWSPGRKLGDDEKTLFAPQDAPTRLFGQVTALDGRRLFRIQGGKSEAILISDDGDVAFLTREQFQQTHRMFRGLYENNDRYYSPLGEQPPPVPTSPGSVICKDRHGRLYFRLTTRGNGIGVLWPKFEKPGDALRVTSVRRMVRTLQDSSGTIWGRPYRGDVALVKWDGAKWVDTPVKLLPHPAWTARLSAPWYRWQWLGPVLMPGANGSFLAVVVRDVYQDIAAKLKGKAVYPGKLYKLGKAAAEKRGRHYWLEGWLLKDGKWTGPLPIENLIQKERAFLTKHFTAHPRHSSLFNLQSDGKHLWAAYEGKVAVYTPDKTFEWKLPDQPSHQLPQVGFCVLPDGRMLCSMPTKEQYHFQLHALTLKEDGIQAEAFAMPTGQQYSVRNPYWNDWYPYVTAKGDLWLWLGYYVFQYRDGKWVKREDLNRPLFDEPDGSLWFMPGRGHESFGENRGYRIVKGDVTHTYSWPDKYMFGRLTPAPNGQVHVACGYWQVTLSKAADPCKRRIITERITEYWLAPPIFVDGKGNFLFSGSVGRTLQMR